MAIQWRFSTLTLANAGTLWYPTFMACDGSLGRDHYYYWIQYNTGMPVLPWDPELKHSIRVYNKSVLDKIKGTNIYTYAYKTKIDIEECKKDYETFASYYKKASHLCMGIMEDEIWTKKFKIDMIEQDSDYINEKFAEIPQEWRTQAHKELIEEINKGNEIGTGVNYETLYKYNVIATKELINKVEI